MGSQRNGWLTVLTVAVLVLGYANGQFSNPPGVPIWCGKAYQASNASFHPGGWLDEPPKSSEPLLDLKIYPRMHIYVAGEQHGTFVIDAALSYINGDPYFNSTFDKNANANVPFTKLIVEVSITDTGEQLIGGGKSVPINSTANEFEFSLELFSPQFHPYAITLVGSSIDGNQSYITTTQLYVLPARDDGGSITKLDNLYSGLLIQDYLSNSTEWTPLFPYSYYVSWDGFLAQSLSNVDLFASYGYNLIHIIPPGGSEPFNWTFLDPFLDRMDALQLWIMWDMRHTYKNQTSLTAQVNHLKHHRSLLLWYTADEPDGVGDPLDAPRTAYDTLRALDPYHPTSLVLNCANFHYAPYSAGADVVLADPYPIGINASHSIVWDTPCNATYGDCGCDNCAGRFEDVADKLDALARYDTWLGRGPAKARWVVPQAFGNESYWPRYPSAGEEAVLAVLGVNHGAKGVVAWNFPTTGGIREVTSGLAKALTGEEVVGLVLGSKGFALVVKGKDRVDAVGWTVGERMH